jgi:DNA modification methylase
LFFLILINDLCGGLARDLVRKTQGRTKDEKQRVGLPSGIFSYQDPQTISNRTHLSEAEESYKPLAPYWASREIGVALYQGDALQMLRICKAEVFDLVFADPPYFLSDGGITCHSGKMVSVNKGGWASAKTLPEIHKFNREWLQECFRVLKEDGSIFVSGTLHNIYSIGFAMQELGYHILNDIVWYKINLPPSLSCRYFVHSTETILWARKSESARHRFNYAEMKAIGDPRPGKQMQSLWRIPPPAIREALRKAPHTETRGPS